MVTGRVISADDGEGLPGVSVLVKGTTIGTSTDGFGNYSLALPSNASTLVFSFIGFVSVESAVGSVVNVGLQPDVKALAEVVVTGYGTDTDGSSGQPMMSGRVKKAPATIPLEIVQTINPTHVEFQIEHPYTIPDDGKTYTVDMETHEIPALYEYYCAPKLEPDAFLTAHIVNWESYNLLEGEVNLYFEDTYVGKSVLDVNSVKDTLELSLGRDKGIVVQRTKLKDYSRSKLLGSNQTETRAWEIEVRNKKQQKIHLTIDDQFPVSNTKEIQVERIDYPEAHLNEDTGHLRWEVDLGANQSKKVGFKYAVKYPKERQLLIE